MDQIFKKGDKVECNINTRGMYGEWFDATVSRIENSYIDGEQKLILFRDDGKWSGGWVAIVCEQTKHLIRHKHLMWNYEKN